MKHPDRRPAWWQLYLLVVGMIGLLVLGARAPLSEFDHEAAAIGTLVLGFGLAEYWLRANSRAFLHTGEMTLVRQSRPGSLDGQDAQYTAILVSRPEDWEADAPRRAEGVQTPLGRCE